MKIKNIFGDTNFIRGGSDPPMCPLASGVSPYSQTPNFSDSAKSLTDMLSEILMLGDKQYGYGFCVTGYSIFTCSGLRAESVTGYSIFTCSGL
jgi:hypothetical protein